MRPFFNAVCGSAILALLVANVGCQLTETKPPAEKTSQFDVIVYGGTSAGVVAAVQSARMGQRTVLINPDHHLGGLTAGGLGATDIGNKGAIGGIAREFYERIARHYAQNTAWRQESRDAFLARRKASQQQSKDPVAEARGIPAQWAFEPHVAESLFQDFLTEAGVTLITGERLDLQGGVRKPARRILSIRMESGKVFAGRMFIDATYEGDLMAKAGVSYQVGREDNAMYGETLNGVQTRKAVKHQFTKRVDPYVVPGDPSSGLLPGIRNGSPGKEGAGDHRVQAYNFRLCLTDAPENRRPIPQPPGYDAQRYELLRRYIAAGVFDALNLNTPMPNRKTDINNHGAFSSDHIGANYDYPEASYKVRDNIFRDHRNYLMGMWWFLQNDSRLPNSVREAAGRWGVCLDEFTETDGWPHQLYVREARRMISDYVMTEHNCRRQKTAEDSVGLAAYGMDSHNVQRYVKDGAAINEGDVQVGVAKPYPISYRACVPKVGECENLLVPVCLSASHIAYGSIRMEPVFMVLGQSAATAAVFAMNGQVAVQGVDYAKLRKRLQQDQQILDWTPTPR